MCPAHHVCLHMHTTCVSCTPSFLLCRELSKKEEMSLKLNHCEHGYWSPEAQDIKIEDNYVRKLFGLILHTSGCNFDSKFFCSHTHTPKKQTKQTQVLVFWYSRAARVARKIFAIFETCVSSRSLKVPVSKCLCYSATFYSILAPDQVALKALAVDEARVQEVAIRFGALENRLNLLVKDIFVVLKGCFSLLSAIGWQAGLPVTIVQDYCIILRVEHEYRCLDVSIYILHVVCVCVWGGGGGGLVLNVLACIIMPIWIRSTLLQIGEVALGKTRPLPKAYISPRH